jgi:hypothetical protein
MTLLFNSWCLHLLDCHINPSYPHTQVACPVDYIKVLKRGDQLRKMETKNKYLTVADRTHKTTAATTT